MSENINSNSNSNVNNNLDKTLHIQSENIETIDFDELDRLNETKETKETKEIGDIEKIKGVAESDNDEDIIESIEDIEIAENAEIDDSPDSSGSSLPSLSFQEQIENDEFLKEAFERVERDREKNKNLVSLNKLGELKEGEVKYLQIGDACIEVHTSLPYREIINGVQTTIALVLDDRPYISEPIKQIVNDIFLLRAYTNLDFSFFEEIEFEPSRIYDIYGLLVQEDVINKVKNLIDKKQLDFWNKSLDSTLNGIINYRNSAMGIINNITEKQVSSENSIENIMQTLKDSENAEAIQNILKLMNVEDK